MTQVPETRLCDAIARHLAALPPEPPTLVVTKADHGTLRLTPTEAREVLYGPETDERLRGAVWRQAVSAAQRETSATGPWQLLAIWLALPRLYRTVHRAAARFGADPADVQAEAVLGLLEQLASVDPEKPDLADTLTGAARRRAWALAAQSAGQTCVADIAAIAAARLAHDPSAMPAEPEHGWELGIDPPARADGLSASIRFTASPAQIEGERLGALAQGLGLREIVHRARRPGEGTLIGTLSLRPAGERR
ncbi:hypothetical protein ACFQL8_00525 [Streptomyces goshikiensis]|uniref:hypothetical protein n=1 Tax=Streptomyces goshikiensis TaxID=1942 RepID=UPI00167261C5|nr:hypothetical protein [Streptomyces goshikiensis]GHD76818.1 hypothetical protein GCM10010336_55040 [Streptomyces goshikiensis]